MGYVMVPVPEEYEEELTNLVLGMSIRSKMSRWPPGSLEELLSSLDDTGARIVSEIIQIAEQRRLCRSPDLAAATGLSEGDLGDFVQSLAERCWAAGTPTLVLKGKTSERGPDGTPVDVLTYVVPPDVRVRVVEELAATGRGGTTTTAPSVPDS